MGWVEHGCNAWPSTFKEGSGIWRSTFYLDGAHCAFVAAKVNQSQRVLDL
jgi:hypothetical protein